MVTVEHVIQETTLAWALAEAAKPHLSTAERDDVYVAIGTGENFAAIRQLITWIVAKRIALPGVLLEWCTTWLRDYVGHEDEHHLHHLIEYIRIRSAI